MATLNTRNKGPVPLEHANRDASSAQTAHGDRGDRVAWVRDDRHR